MSPSTPDDADPEREVRRVHLLLEDWYGGIREDIDPLMDAFAEEFTLIDATGTLFEGEAAVEKLQTDREEYLDSTPPVAVEVSDITAQRALYGVHQVTFSRRMRINGDWSRSRCSLWFRETNRVSTGLQWIHLQETPVTGETAPDETE